ncbi:hypothetical protein MNBD_DELTA01-48 [hydrothermal vent metagenome]|uniref:Uncharacterized protein n=1 Tax=hydrothermal vent metagenome TaxID=652676 RepID=A0A3B0RG21_9ZZZZ
MQETVLWLCCSRFGGLVVQIGINQDIVFKGERFHIQTEDSGVKRPVISTILFKGGIVVTSRKIGYEDKLNSSNLDKEVSELMQGQHMEVIRALKKGDFEKDKEVKAADKTVAAKKAVSVESATEPAACLQPAEQEKSKRPLRVPETVLEDKVLECLSLK